MKILTACAGLHRNEIKKKQIIRKNAAINRKERSAQLIWFNLHFFIWQIQCDVIQG